MIPISGVISGQSTSRAGGAPGRVLGGRDLAGLALIGVFGGGVAFAAMFVAIVQALATTYLWPNYGDAYPFVILVVVLAVRPQGLVRMVTGVRY